MNILVLGATGLIGQVVADRLARAGHDVTGLARNIRTAQNRMSHIQWVSGDLAHLTQSDRWTTLLMHRDVIINCVGALQDGLLDRLEATQAGAMIALFKAAAAREKLPLIVQISADTQSGSNDLTFLSTKKQADEALKASGLPHVILRPALVLGRNAHGGSALLRALGSIPYAIPLVHAQSPVATIGLDDLADTVVKAVEGELPWGADISVGRNDGLRLRDLVLLHSRWLGMSGAPILSLPALLARPVTLLADIAGYLGWRSPLRSTALAVMTRGIHTTAHDHSMFKSAADVLQAAPAGVQDLWFARLYLLKPLIVAGLALFWFLSGVIPLFALSAAQVHFEAFLPSPLALWATVATCLADIVLGVLVLVRPYARAALKGMLGLTAIYLVSASLVEPALWLDPLGPLVKVIPSILLTLVALAISDER